MFNTVVSGRGVSVLKSYSLPYQPGAVYWDGARLCIVDGQCNKVPLESKNIEISVDVEVQQALDWVKNKMQEEVEMNNLIATHPGLKDAKETFDIMLALVRNSEEKNEQY